MAKLELGRTVMTQGVASAIAGSSAFEAHVSRSMGRYLSQDWGDIDKETGTMNEKALGKKPDRVLAVYKMEGHPEWKIWIITECDRSVTTILFPCEN